MSENSFDAYAPKDKYPSTEYLYLDVIASFLYHNERTYAFTVLESWKENIKKNSTNAKTLGNRISYWKKYEVFIGSIDVHDYIKNGNDVIPEQELELIRKSFNKPDLYQLDGMAALVRGVGEKEIIKLAIKSSYFFDTTIAKDRFDKIVSAIESVNPWDCALPARKSQKNGGSQKANEGTHDYDIKAKGYKYTDEHKFFSHPITKDSNGNAEVCSIINQYTGYNLNVNLENKPFKNYIISHIWGRAIDPRFFTNLWNVVLVPAWVNHLLDKNETDALAAKLKTTFMDICIKYYGLKDYDWSKLTMSCPSAPKLENPEFHVCGVFQIQVIQQLDDTYKAKVSKIKKVGLKV